MSELNDFKIEKHNYALNYVSLFLLDDNENFKKVTEDEFYSERENLDD
jgi:hypothetical protein